MSQAVQQQCAEAPEPLQEELRANRKQQKEQRKRAVAAEVDNVLKESLADPPSLAELSRRFYISRTKLCCDYREVTGKSVGERLLELRIESAKDLLEHSNLSIGRISQQVGYRFQSSFATAFSRETGRTPQQWRASHRTPAAHRTSMPKPAQENAPITQDDAPLEERLAG